eukprot:754892-Hanusia_phi.AAC.1
MQMKRGGESSRQAKRAREARRACQEVRTKSGEGEAGGARRGGQTEFLQALADVVKKLGVATQRTRLEKESEEQKKERKEKDEGECARKRSESAARVKRIEERGTSSKRGMGQGRKYSPL